MIEEEGGKERPFVYRSFPGDVRLGIDHGNMAGNMARSAVSVCDAISGGCHGFSFPIHGTVSFVPYLVALAWPWLRQFSISGLGLGCYFSGMGRIATVLPQ